jgi:hypothetical protein
MYDDVMIQNDMSIYLGFTYTTLWIAFSLLIMFNITISIVQEVLTVETYRSEHKEIVDEPAAPFSVISSDMGLGGTRRAMRM